MFNTLFHPLLLPLLLFIPHTCATTTCPPGSFLSHATCHLCPAGTYQPLASQTYCLPCPPGTFSAFPGAEGHDLCRRCPTDTFSPNNASTTCSPCPVNTNANPGSSSCHKCPPGTNLNFHRCEPCRIGQYSNQTSNLICETCPTGTTTDKPRSKTIQDCKPPSSPACASRPNVPCGNCDPGFVYSTSRNECMPCPAGSFSATRGARTCTKCPINTFAGLPFSTRCLPCPKGSTSAQGAMICQLDNAPCPANYFANHHGSCVTCGPNQRLSRSTNKCVACEDGMFSRGGVSHVCETCPHGMQYVQRLDNCLCKPGLVPTVAGGCVKCPLGRVRGDLEAGPVCERCYFGSVARNKGMETCSVCPEGMFQPNMGEAKCIKCPEGTVQETGSFGRRCVSTRSNCQLGFDRILDGDLFTCVRRGKCPTGTFERVGNMGKECATCPKGMRYVKEEAKCIQCGAREVSYGGVSTKCQECSRGMFRYRPEGDTCRCIEAGYGLYDGTCKKCLPGSFSVYYKQTCTLCPKGTFTSITGTLSACPRCPRNFFTDVEGATHCKPCPKGTVSYGVGESVCVPLAYS